MRGARDGVRERSADSDGGVHRNGGRWSADCTYQRDAGIKAELGGIIGRLVGGSGREYSLAGGQRGSQREREAGVAACVRCHRSEAEERLALAVATRIGSSVGDEFETKARAGHAVQRS